MTENSTFPHSIAGGNNYNIKKGSWTFCISGKKFRSEAMLLFGFKSNRIAAEESATLRRNGKKAVATSS